jgi:elongator complex protein 6
MAADAPLVHNASTMPSASFSSEQRRATPLEEEHAAFLIATAHRARMVMQLRNLDTGVAKDVSGVLRISKGGGISGMASDIKIHDESGDQWEPKEILYHVQRDAGVRVFERGE